MLIIIIINNYKVLNDAGQEEKFVNTGKQNFIIKPQTSIFEICTGSHPQVFWKKFFAAQSKQDNNEATCFTVRLRVDNRSKKSVPLCVQGKNYKKF